MKITLRMTWSHWQKFVPTMIRFERGKEMTVFMSGRSEVLWQWSASQHLIRSQMTAVKCDHNVIIKTNFPHQHLRFVIKFNCSYVRHQERSRNWTVFAEKEALPPVLRSVWQQMFNLILLIFGFAAWLLCSTYVTSCRNTRVAAEPWSSFYCKWRDDVIQSRSDMMGCCEYLHGGFQHCLQTLLLCS